MTWTSWGVRARLVASTAVPLAAALALAAVAVAVVFSASLVRDLDRQTRAEAAVVAELIRSDRLPRTLPLPDGSPLLAQVVADDDATVLAASPAASLVQPLRTGGGPRVGTDEQGGYAGTPLRVRSVPAVLAGRPVQVVVAAPLADVRRALHALRLVLLLVVPALVAAVAALAWAVAGLALRPVERLRAAADRLARDVDAPVDLPAVAGGDEVGRLAGTLQDLLDAVRGLVAQQRSFVADAAHELRSPLASLAVQLDVARAHPSTTTVAGLVLDLAPEVERLQRLVADLLVLTRLQSAGGPVRVPVDLRALAGADGEGATVPGDPEALQRLVANLRDNALRHGRRVAVTTSLEGPWAVLDVDDDGPGIAAADRERVLERWVRLDDARAGGDGGAGLGLAIVRETARAHGGDVEVLDSPLGGARLRVRLPR